jgi:hypothetical protein
VTRVTLRARAAPGKYIEGHRCARRTAGVFDVMGDRGVDYGERRRGDGTEREPDYGGRRFVATEPVEWVRRESPARDAYW